MFRSFLKAVVLVGLLVPPVALPTPAAAVTVNIQIGSNLNQGRRLSCSDGERLLRNRGFREIRRIDCGGRFFVYRAWRNRNKFEIALRARDGEVIDVRWLRRR